MNIILLGGRGFLGSHLARHFALAGKNVFVVSRNQKSVPYGQVVATGDWGSIQNILSDSESSVIINCLAVYGGTAIDVGHMRYAHVDLPILAARMLPARKHFFVNVGSSLNPDVSMYAKTKSEFSDWLISTQEVNSVNLCCELFYGLEDPARNLISKLILKGLVRQDPFKMTSGEQKRHFVYIEDVVSAIDCVVNRFHQDNTLEQSSYHVGSDCVYSIRQLVAQITELLGSFQTDLLWGQLPSRVNEGYLDLPKSLTSLGWQPTWSLERGLKATILEYQRVLRGAE